MMTGWIMYSLVKLRIRKVHYFCLFYSQVWITNAAAVLVHTDTSGWVLESLFRWYLTACGIWRLNEVLSEHRGKHMQGKAGLFSLDYVVQQELLLCYKVLVEVYHCWFFWNGRQMTDFLLEGVEGSLWRNIMNHVLFRYSDTNCLLCTCIIINLL